MLFSYLNQRYISSLDRKSIGFGFRKNKKGLGFSVSQKGDKRLKDSNFSLAYSQVFADKFSLGLRLHYRDFSFSDIYGRKSIVYGSFGFLLKYDDANIFSFQITNPSREVLVSEFNERLETTILSGYSHKFSEKFSLNAELEKGLKSNFNLKTGFIYEMNGRTTFLMGYESSYRKVSLGLEIKFNKISSVFAFSYEGQLGFRSGIGISYSFSKS